MLATLLEKLGLESDSFLDMSPDKWQQVIDTPKPVKKAPSERELKLILGQLEHETKCQVWWITDNTGNPYEFHFFPPTFTEEQIEGELNKIMLVTFKYHGR